MAHDGDIISRTPRCYPFSRNRLDLDPQYAELRRTEPVCRVQLPYGPSAWLVTGYHLTKSVFGMHGSAAPPPSAGTIPASARSSSARLPRA